MSLSPSPRKLAPSEFRKRSVLVVGEEIGFRNIVISMCRSLEFRQVATAKTPAEAIDMMQIVAFDFVVCHWTQPPLDGPRFAACVRSSNFPSIKRVPVILIGDYARSEIPEGEAGMTEILRRPFSTLALAQMFERVIL